MRKRIFWRIIPEVDIIRSEAEEYKCYVFLSNSYRNMVADIKLEYIKL